MGDSVVHTHVCDSSYSGRENELPVSGAETNAQNADAGVAGLVEAHVLARPEGLAVCEPLGGARLTFAELWERAGWLAAELALAGVARGDLVAIDRRRSADLVVAMLGIVRAGAAYLPLDAQAPADRVTGILAESGVRAVVCGDEGSRVRVAGVRPVPVPRRRPAGSVPDVHAAGEEPIYVTYTSGSTGRPKGVVIPHRAVVRLVVAPNYCPIRPGDRVANTCNPAFDVTTSEIWGALAAGATVVPFPDLTAMDLADWLDLLRSEDITTMFLTTSLFHSVVWDRPAAFASLRDLVVGGEQLDLAAVRRTLAAGPPSRLVNGYGPTEGTSFATYFECTEESVRDVDRVPIGYALQQTGLSVLDEVLRPVAPGETGELCLSGPGVATGYLNRPELTAEKFVVEPSGGERVYRTGDLVRRLPSGALEMLGRRDRQVKLRGFRIELEEIERAIAGTGLVDAAFVEMVGDGATAMLASCVLPPRSAVDLATLADRLAAKLRESLPEYMVPSRWIVLEELPVGATGKADRAAMAAMLAGPRTGEAPGWGDDSFAPVRTIVAEMLGVPAVSPVDNFVELGGNSILAIRIAHRVRAQLALPVQPADVLRAESMAHFAERVHELEPQLA
jgi:amino acid adenylation domain-containing protein